MLAYDYMNARQREQWERFMNLNLEYAAGRIAWSAQAEHEENEKQGRSCDCGVCKPVTS
jgi:hypothetical protein